jgi:Cu/Ag efflux protein CusF
MVRHGLLLAALASASAFAGDSEWVAGTIVKLEPARGLVTLAHGPIRSLDMAAMTMPFKVAEPAQLAARRVGDRVRFVVSRGDEGLVVTRIEPAP